MQRSKRFMLGDVEIHAVARARSSILGTIAFWVSVNGYKSYERTSDVEKALNDAIVRYVKVLEIEIPEGRLKNDLSKMTMTYARMTARKVLTAAGYDVRSTAIEKSVFQSLPGWLTINLNETRKETQNEYIKYIRKAWLLCEEAIPKNSVRYIFNIYDEGILEKTLFEKDLTPKKRRAKRWTVRKR